MGEYSALCCSGAMSLEDTAIILSKRGKAMQSAVKSGDGAMAAIIGISLEEVKEAISNILDRAINGYVVDFILIHYENYFWPAFNLADIYITIGIIVLIMTFFIRSEED